MQIRTWTGNDAQKWRIVKNGDGKTWRILCCLPGTGRIRALDFLGGGKDNGVLAGIWEYKGNPNQKWYFDPVPGTGTTVKNTTVSNVNFSIESTGRVISITTSKKQVSSNALKAISNELSKNKSGLIIAAVEGAGEGFGSKNIEHPYGKYNALLFVLKDGVECQ